MASNVAKCLPARNYNSNNIKYTISNHNLFQNVPKRLTYVNPGAIDVPPMTTIFSASSFLVSMGD